ncbi:MFS transporter [Variovorax sp. EL159]|uniref:MFS transporter n=1 Tax=Variovorax sp. EL159 TaxID=1566270 RepID=UPI00088B936B|nr:MFS transporter [Variovorax sp. EL159]SCX72544.1 Predicted arabinose efflux permease, MFS family [Variovorax sp. EL159]
MQLAPQPAGPEPAHAPVYPWLVVALFLACHVFSYIDRQVISLLVQPMKASMGLSDTQIGLLQGLAFGLFYAMAGVPIAWLVDSGRRARIAWVCVGLWSFATMGSGVVKSFASLLAMRAATAIGEAGLPTAAMSIFSDLFPRHKLARATGFFILGPFIGGGLALVLGAAVLGHFGDVTSVDVPRLGALEPWRIVFLVVGAPGLLLAAAVALLIREPARRSTVLLSGRADDVDRVRSIRETVHVLFTEHGYFLVCTLGLTCAVIVFFCVAAWFPTHVIRLFSLAPASAGQTLGPIFIVCGASGTVLASLLATAGSPANPLRRVYGVTGICLIGLLGSVLGLFVAVSYTASLAVYGCAIFFLSGVMSLGPVPAQIVLPNRMRAQGMALQALLFSVVGAGLGPLLVGAVSDGLGSGHPISVGRALALVALPATLCSMVLFAASYRMLFRSRGSSPAPQPI